jgi:hypothetical protein
MSEYLRFVQAPTPAGRKTQVWMVLSARTNDPLGLILWRGGWRQYVFEPEPMTVWSVGCMTDVQTFIGGLMAARRNAA